MSLYSDWSSASSTATPLKDNGRPGAKYRSNSASAREAPWDRANLLSKYALYFMLPMLCKGYKGQLNLDDIGVAPRSDQARRVGLRLQQNYNRELLSRSEPSLLRALFRTFGTQLFFISILDFISKCIAYPMQTIALGWLIRDAGIYLNLSNLQQQLAATTVLANATTATASGVIETSTEASTTTATATATTLAPPLPTIGPAMLEAAQSMTINEAYWRIIYDALLLILCTWVAVVVPHPYFLRTYHIGLKCRVGACYLIYKKSLRLSQSAMSETTVGQMVNLLSNDVNRFDQVVQMVPALVIAPIQAVVVICVLSIGYLGLYPTLAILVTIISFVVVQTAMGRGFSKLRAKTAKRTDERVRLMNEIILAVRIIKMYAWEAPFKQLVYIARKREITTIGLASILKTINQTLFFVSSKIVVFVGLITYVLLGLPFNPEIVFVTIGLANLVRLSLTLFFPNAVAFCAETVVSCRRLDTFLRLPEIESSPATYRTSSDGYGCKYAITMSKVYSSWAAKGQDLAATSDARWAIIRNLSLAIKPRDLVLVIGRVGSGKTSVLMSILGELPIASGKLEVNGKVSYASQEAWIFSGTIRENILFGKPYEAARYNEVIRVCSLERDIEILIDGDATIVGERGVSLSGGQKARVNLARALYNEADIYLLDDPLSAVDAPVARHIFNESLRSFLRKKTVILATHQLQFLRYASKVLVVDRDSPAAYGTLQEVMESEAFAVVGYGKEAFEDATTTEAGTDSEFTRSAPRSTSRSQSRQSRTGSVSAAAAAPTTTTPPTASTSGSSGGSQSPPKKAAAKVDRKQDGDDDDDDDDDDENNGNNEDKDDKRDDSDQEGNRLIRAASQASSNLNQSAKGMTPLSMDGKQKSGSMSVSDETSGGQRALGDEGKPKRRDKSRSGKRGATAGSERRQGTETLSAVAADCSTYVYYVNNAFGIIMLVWFILVNLAAQGFYVYTDFFLSFWTDSVQRKEYQGAQFQPISYVDSLTLSQICTVYAGLVGLAIVATFLRVTTFFAASLRASINIHDRLFYSVIHAPMTFFDFSPIGILLNRLSRDIGFVDELLPQTGIEIVTIFVNISGILVMAIIIDPQNAIASLLLLTVVFILRNFCARTITRLKQIEGVNRSPIFSHISTTLSGLATIRAFKVQDEFGRVMDRHQDRHSSAWFSYSCACRWLTVSMDWICLTFITVVITVLLTVSLDGTNASLVGLLISQIVVLPGPFQWGMRQMIEFESQMTSVQRIKEFSMLKPEADQLTEPPSPPSGADNKTQVVIVDYQAQDSLAVGERFRPEAGEVKFTDLTLSYFADEPPVLKSLSFTIKPSEKVGVVGRTGAGKSSIVSVLFRLYNFEGKIEIDGHDTKALTLDQLRRSMSIIPQDPVLFGGSVRKNLDPFNEYSDSELWSALEAVKLKALFSRYPQGLDFVINEGGSNFSVGQRQLICLARAIVRRNKILILDEATANVDPETDVFIQQTIASQFKDCTVITIAHRLVTIVDSDRVLVLDRGQVREFGSPYELIQDETSLFAQMVDSSAQQAARLRKSIEEEHLRRRQAATGGRDSTAGEQ